MNSDKLQTPYERFKKIFKKSEQICIYGMDWETHGYISNIEFDGVTLTQLRNLKGIKYPWNCFEVIAHAGYKITKSKISEVKDIFEFKISTHSEKSTSGLPLITDLPKKVITKQINEYEILDTELYFPTDLKFKKREIQKDFEVYTDEWDKNILRININFKIAGLSGYMQERMIWKDSINTQIYPIIDNVISPILIEFPEKNESFGIRFKKQGYIHNGNIIYDSGCTPDDDFEIWCDDGLEAFRKLEWKKKKIKPSTLGCGDPVIFDGIPVDYKTWKSKDGFVMANHHADIYV